MAAYAFSIFTGAFLLFQVQPLIGKYVLPWFGGAPSVWTTCMLFFQVLLLAGYAYAHWSSRWLRPKHQFLLHLALVGLALVMLPITPSETWKPAIADEPTYRILGLLAASVGLPYFVLSATAPLLQHWFSLTHPGRSPFRLYALSNAGSLLALLSYPTLVETQFTRVQQAAIWGTGLVCYACLCVWTGINVWRWRQPQQPPSTPTDRETTGPASAQWSLWLLLPACATLLLLAVTNKICQDVAVIPFLWILPLSLYLLSFIICFDHPRWYRRGPFGVALLLMLLLMALVASGVTSFSISVQILVYTVGLFVCCMVCHGEVYRLKPAPAYLTSYYLALAAGGALGGVLVAVVAPRVFGDYYELDWGVLACGTLFLLVAARGRRKSPFKPWPQGAWAASWLLLAGVAGLLWRAEHKHANVSVFRARNFYGVLSVYRYDRADPRFSLVEMSHGHIAHGMQFMDPEKAKSPTLYYSQFSGIGRLLTATSKANRNIGLIGLGAGTLAAYAHPGDSFRFYEINADVERGARTFFTYLTNCAGSAQVILGDARLSLAAEPPQNYDLLVLDAFSSDSIPIHLLTREAFAIYERHLKPAAVIAVHISNVSLNLEPVVFSLAKQLGYHATVIEHREVGDNWWLLPSLWVLMSKDPNALNFREIREGERQPAWNPTKATLWTDDFAAVFPLLKRSEFLPWARNEAAELTKKGVEREGLGDFAGAIELYRRAVCQDPGFAPALNNLAWLLATVPNGSLRNGKEAVIMGESACAMTGYQRPVFIGTLAAAYAEAARFDEAVETAERAARMAEQLKDPLLAEQNRRLLELYRNHKPYRQTSG